jgi:hypothetical protein
VSTLLLPTSWSEYQFSQLAKTLNSFICQAKPNSFSRAQ